MEYATVGDARVPKIGVGTRRSTGRRCYEAVSTALELGYRHVDTAQTYGNERQVGRAVADADVDREELFLTTKVDPRDAGYDDLILSVGRSLERLGVETIDLLLLHWPNPLVDIEETMAAMNALRAAGHARHVGVSNFSVERLDRARAASDGPILADQVRFHPYRPRRELLRYCQRNDVLLAAASPLGHGGAVRDETLREIGRDHGKTPAQVALRWAIQHENVVAVPRSTDRDHLVENLAVFDFSLSRAELDRIARPSLYRAGVAFVRGRLGV